ncbi:hypothetical protein AB4865_02920 [Capnocytophaga sp. ARDL2]|uniref:hypothetical protein n=1 Tax=Capnocytophaga sp. ARDL2 TaxID=3238809 RepID=UPI003558826C
MIDEDKHIKFLFEFMEPQEYHITDFSSKPNEAIFILENEYNLVKLTARRKDGLYIFSYQSDGIDFKKLMIPFSSMENYRYMENLCFNEKREEFTFGAIDFEKMWKEFSVDETF